MRKGFFLFSTRIAVIAMLIAAVASSAVAQTAKLAARSPAHPEWAGLYRMARSPADLVGNTPTANMNPFITKYLQPWAKMKMEATNGVADDTAAVCHPDGIFRLLIAVGGFFIVPTPDQVTMIMGEIEPGGVRRIYLNRPHPQNLPPTWNGDAVGHWEGDTLVVDTVGFNDKSWLMTAMQPHTEELHVVERIRYIAEPQLLEIVTTVEDRKALTMPYTYSLFYKKTGAEMPEVICNGDLGEQELWMGFRKNALKTGYTPPPGKSKD